MVVMRDGEVIGVLDGVMDVNWELGCSEAELERFADRLNEIGCTSFCDVYWGECIEEEG